MQELFREEAVSCAVAGSQACWTVVGTAWPRAVLEVPERVPIQLVGDSS